MKRNKLFLILVIVLATILGALGYFAYRNYQLNKNISALTGEFLQTKADFESAKLSLQRIINSTTQELEQTKASRDDFEQKYYNEYARVNQLFAQVENIQATVENLEKLEQIDPELLKKYSKVYFLSENYVPESFVKIDAKYTINPANDYLFYSKTWPFLQNLLTAAANEGVDIKINSAYRSFETQTQVKTRHTVIFGSGANQFSADQGYSEHQLGTTADFITSQISDLSEFEKEPAYSWLLNNAYKFGFILSYPQNNQFYIFEPWHWRFVGRALADRLHAEGRYFYDFDQREIDKYLINLFD